MIKKLRFKFILVSMLSILVVLLLTIGSINIYNYANIRNEISTSLNDVLRRGFESGHVPMDPGNPGDRGPEMGRIHYFLISFASDGSVEKSDFSHIFSLTDEEGTEMGNNAYKITATEGNFADYYYKKSPNGESTYVAFIDAKEKLDSFKGFLIPSIIVSSFAYAVLFVLIFISSKIVFRVSEESYRKQKSFITNASHELKTPLTIISTDLEIVEMDHGKSEWTSSIRDQVDRLTKMTNQLVILARLDEGDMSKYPMGEFDISKTVQECAESFIPSFKKAGLELSLSIDEGLMLNGNKYLLEELTLIFMDNALKYTAEKGKAEVTLSKDRHGHLNLAFVNDIEENAEIDKDLLFERFYRSQNTKKEGSGIGLSIAREIINIHKGSVNVSLEDKKIIFLILF